MKCWLWRLAEPSSVLPTMYASVRSWGSYWDENKSPGHTAIQSGNRLGEPNPESFALGVRSTFSSEIYSISWDLWKRENHNKVRNWTRKKADWVAFLCTANLSSLLLHAMHVWCLSGEKRTDLDRLNEEKTKNEKRKSCKRKESKRKEKHFHIEFNDKYPKLLLLIITLWWQWP